MATSPPCLIPGSTRTRLGRAGRGYAAFSAVATGGRMVDHLPQAVDSAAPICKGGSSCGELATMTILINKSSFNEAERCAEDLFRSR